MVNIIALTKEGSKIIGYTVINEHGNCNTFLAESFKKMLANGMKLENAELRNGEVVGTNGSLERYTKIDYSAEKIYDESLVILYKTDDNKFYATDYSGERELLDEAEIVKYPIANGKVVENNGKKYVSAINGRYRTQDEYLKSVHARTQSMDKNVLKDRVDEPVIKKEEELNKLFNQCIQEYAKSNNIKYQFGACVKKEGEVPIKFNYSSCIFENNNKIVDISLGIDLKRAKYTNSFRYNIMKRVSIKEGNNNRVECDIVLKEGFRAGSEKEAEKKVKKIAIDSIKTLVDLYGEKSTISKGNKDFLNTLMRVFKIK